MTAMLVFESEEKRNEAFFYAIREIKFLMNLDNKYYRSTKKVQDLEIKSSINCVLYDIVGLSEDKQMSNEDIDDFKIYKGSILSIINRQN